MSAAKYFASNLSIEGSESSSIRDNEPLSYGKDTLLYFINFSGDKGWVVVSGDKRTEPILASSETGRIDKNNLGRSKVWFEEVTSRLVGLKSSNNNDTTSNFYRMWQQIDALTSGKTFIRHSNKSDLRMDEGKNEEEYEDVLIEVTTEVLTNKEVGPLIKTKWGQGFPWNQSTPKWKGTSTRCVTGCVATAGAQML